MYLSEEEKREIEREVYKEVCSDFYKKQFELVYPKSENCVNEITSLSKKALSDQNYFVLRRRPNGMFSTVLNVSWDTHDALYWEQQTLLHFGLTSSGSPCFTYRSFGSKPSKPITSDYSRNGIRFEAVRKNATLLHPETELDGPRYFYAESLADGFEIGEEFCILD